MAAFECAKKLVWATRLLTGMQITVVLPAPILEDNKATILLSRKPSLNSGQSRRMQVRWHWMQVQVEERAIRLTYIPTHAQVADLFTKSTSRSIFSQLSPLLQGTAPIYSGAVATALSSLRNETKNRIEFANMMGESQQGPDQEGPDMQVDPDAESDSDADRIRRALTTPLVNSHDITGAAEELLWELPDLSEHFETLREGARELLNMSRTYNMVLRRAKGTLVAKLSHQMKVLREAQQIVIDEHRRIPSQPSSSSSLQFCAYYYGSCRTRRSWPELSVSKCSCRYQRTDG